MTTYTKIKWTLGILLVFGLVVATNLIDQNNFTQVRNSAVTIYEDRLAAKDLILDLHEITHQKEVAALRSDTSFFRTQNQRVNKDVQGILDQYRSTKLTDKEGRVFGDLQSSLKKLQNVEATVLSSKPLNFDTLFEQTEVVKGHLDELSKIQLEEGRCEMLLSNKALDKVKLFTQIEIYLLIVIAVLIQIIVMYDPRRKKMEEG